MLSESSDTVKFGGALTTEGAEDGVEGAGTVSTYCSTEVALAELAQLRLLLRMEGDAFLVRLLGEFTKRVEGLPLPHLGAQYIWGIPNNSKN